MLFKADRSLKRSSFVFHVFVGFRQRLQFQRKRGGGEEIFRLTRTIVPALLKPVRRTSRQPELDTVCFSRMACFDSETDRNRRVYQLRAAAQIDKANEDWEGNGKEKQTQPDGDIFKW